MNLHSRFSSFFFMLSVPTTLSTVHHEIAYLGKANQWLWYFLKAELLLPLLDIIYIYIIYIYIYTYNLILCYIPPVNSAINHVWFDLWWY